MVHVYNVPRICLMCGSTFQAERTRVRQGYAKYCGLECARLALRDQNARRQRTAQERLAAWSMPEPNSGCELWFGSLSNTGYGLLKHVGPEKRTVLAHRASYEVAVGPIPDGYEIDHLCRVRSCINPRHLEAVPHRVNVLRGRAPTVVAARTGCCTRGHALTSENAIVRKDGSRECRICRYAAARKRYAQRRAGADGQ
jgi:hypothetical protein